MKRAKATIGTLAVRKTAINSLIPRHCWPIFGMTLRHGDAEMKTVTLEVATLKEVNPRARPSYAQLDQGGLDP
jgi:hypothetical protein